MMETQARYTLVGTAVLIVTLLLVAGLAWLAGGTDKVNYRHFTIYFVKQSMDGLDVNSAVKLRGIKVGVVTGYEFAGKGQNAVRVTIKVNPDTPVRTNAVAYVERNIVTGLATIALSNPDATSPLLVNAPDDEQYPVIAEGSSDLDKVATAVSRIAENGAQVLDKMNGLLSAENRNGVGKTIENLQQITANLADSKQELSRAVISIKDAADAFREASGSINQVALRAGDSFEDLSSNASTAIKQANATLELLNRETSTVSVRLQGLAETGSLELTSVSRDVRNSADSVGAAGQRFTDPRGLLFGDGRPQPGPGEK
jgi:phospholipid/cholesterol/gamma-HCH transport system substrate-binding protein